MKLSVTDGWIHRDLIRDFPDFAVDLMMATKNGDFSG